jgi:myosin heavy subunit
MLRVSLILAILAGLGVIGVSQFMVKPHLENIITERNNERDEKNRQTQRANKAEKSLKETTAKLEDTTKRLNETSEQLASANKKIEDQTTRLTQLQSDLERTRADLNTAEQIVAQWNAVGVTPDQVKALVDRERKQRDEIAVLGEEKKILDRQVKKLQAKVDQYEQGLEAVVELPAGLKGNVLVVDPKWNFVVLDVGEDKGVLPKGQMLVSRNSKLVAKLKIVSVEQHRCIANIMPGWKIGEVMEGDQVISN